MRTKSETTGHWLNLKHAAELVGISPRQLAKRAVAGEISYKREGRRGRGGVGQLLFSSADIDTYNARKRIPARFESDAAIQRTPSVPCRIFIDPKNCGD